MASTSTTGGWISGNGLPLVFNRRQALKLCAGSPSPSYFAVSIFASGAMLSALCHNRFPSWRKLY
jgi:hypothetical protein